VNVESFDTCSGPYEWGVALASEGVLTPLPQTPSADGQRAYVYAVVQDQFVGDWTLQFELPTHLDVFYRQH
jgi:hypothetical protein